MTEGPLSRVKSVEQAVESLIFLEIILQTSKEDLSCTTANPYRGWGGGWGVGGGGGVGLLVTQSGEVETIPTPPPPRGLHTCIGAGKKLSESADNKP